MARKTSKALTITTGKLVPVGHAKAARDPGYHTMAIEEAMGVLKTAALFEDRVRTTKYGLYDHAMAAASEMGLTNEEACDAAYLIERLALIMRKASR